MSLKVSSSIFKNSHDRNIFIKKIISSSVLGYLACKIFSIVNPLSGFMFNLTAELTDHFTKHIFKKTNFMKNAKLSRGFIKCAISFTAAFFSANYIVNLTLLSAFKIAAFTVITQIAISNILFVGAILGGFALFTTQILYTAIRNA